MVPKRPSVENRLKSASFFPILKSEGGGDGMQIEIRMEESCREPKIIIVTDKITDEINALLKKLSSETAPVIAGFHENTAEILEPSDIIRIYASAGKVFAVTVQGEYLLHLRLYELEERLDSKCFIRISNSEIVNLKKVRGFDLSLAGTICVSLSDGSATYVSRRYVAKIKQVLGI